jgi:MFS family permease
MPLRSGRRRLKAAHGQSGKCPHEQCPALARNSGRFAGNLIEWYDFYIYAFTALYFSSAFFPEGDPLVQIMATSGIFAVGFLIRPIGGWYFGRLADRHGRQRAMVVSVLMMGCGAALIAVLPTYDQVGLAAPALLLLARMIQGFRPAANMAPPPLT